jgi:hypothetical protein
LPGVLLLVFPEFLQELKNRIDTGLVWGGSLADGQFTTDSSGLIAERYL